MIPPEEKWARQVIWFCWSLLLLLALVLLRIKMATAESEALITARDIIVWSVGILSAVVLYFIGHFIQNRLSRFPQKLFKTHFSDKTPYSSREFGKTLILPIGHTCKRFLYVSIKKACDNRNRIGIRPQANKQWHRRWLRNYNDKTQNIAFDERSNPPIRIKSIKDITEFQKENFDRDGDDGACGKFGYYKPETPISMIPGQQIVYEIEIETLKLWKGFIDFRIDTRDGMRVAHHPCEIQNIERRT